jgi:hypothetical protein
MLIAGHVIRLQILPIFAKNATSSPTTTSAGVVVRGAMEISPDFMELRSRLGVDRIIV